MPAFVSEPLQRSPRLTVARVLCDGHDPGRAQDEGCTQDGLWLVLSGSFRLRTTHGVGRMDAMAGMRWRAGMTYQVHHDRGGDVCLSVRGALASMLVDGGAGPLPLCDGAFVRLHRAARLLATGDAGAPLEFEGTLVSALARERRPPPTSPRTRRLADALAHTLRSRFDEKLTLTELAEAHRISPFHACNVFRAAMGTSLHQYQLEVRLRHALALVLDTQRPLAVVALEAGFASQAHLTTRFRRRFGVTPARCRRGGLPTTPV